ncbi:AAA family ATPase [Streptomyces sp. NPDC059009]|uniref:phosphotransferase-like protein n=1 Tax=Streptomyces sp. NPDC059009 TaxID=3346694 RepID=UPI0036916575
MGPGTESGRGRIIFLNGTSSSGKSSIARELLEVLDDGVFFHLSVDGFNAMRSKRELGQEQLDAALRRTREGFHRSVAAMAEVGNDIVVDHVLSEPWRLLDCLAVLPPEDVVFVGVHCPPADPDGLHAPLPKPPAELTGTLPTLPPWTPPRTASPPPPGSPIRCVSSPLTSCASGRA